jgi:Fe-S oxidoreductase
MSVNRVIESTYHCRYCLMCRHVCPVGQVTRLETLSPHGWGLLIASVQRNLLEWNQDTINVLYSCADCGTCRAHCVTDQPLPDAIALSRAEVVNKGLAPQSVYETHQAIVDWSNPYRKQAPQPTKNKGKIALYISDESLYLWPNTQEAIQKLLEVVDVEPVLVGVGRNNGYLPSSLGFPETAKKVAREILDDLEASGAELMLVVSAGDYFTFKQLYNERLGIEWPAQVGLQEVLSFLGDHYEAGNISFEVDDDNIPYAYIDPTHAVRVDNRHEYPRTLLKAVMPTEPVELYWRRERTHPSGNTALQFTNPELANKLTEARLLDAVNSGAKLLISEDPSTLRTLYDHAGKYDLQVKGLYEILVESL